MVQTDYPADTGIDDHLGASDAWLVGHIDMSTTHRDAMQSALDDRILLSMQAAADLLALSGWNIQLLAKTSRFAAVREARWRTVIAGAQDALVLDDHGPDMTAQTG